jgi:hypothetical protein
MGQGTVGRPSRRLQPERSRSSSAIGGTQEGNQWAGEDPGDEAAPFGARSSMSAVASPILLPVDCLTRPRNRMLKNSFSVRLLKKVQMQDGEPGTHPQGWVQVRGVLSTYAAAPRERAGPVRRMGPRRWAFFSSLLTPPACCPEFPTTSDDFNRPNPKFLNRQGAKVATGCGSGEWVTTGGGDRTDTVSRLGSFHPISQSPLLPFRSSLGGPRWRLGG